MAKKKYIKDSKGTTVSITTDTLGLEKPLLNENYDIDVHNRNMDKIDEDLTPIDDSYIIELFQHDGDTTNPRDYYTKVEADEKFASKEEVGNLSQLQTSDKSNLVNAVNEVFQSANNGKELIASAIGEPLNKEDTFSAMSSGINGLLSTFKANMMNNGVTIESGDKFKQLIDKIAELADNEGKGIQFVESNCNISFSSGKKTITTNLPFVPTYIFVYCTRAVVTDRNSGGTNILVSNIGTSQLGQPGGVGIIKTSIKNISKDSFTVDITGTYEYHQYVDLRITKWFAIGVGEEDATLRDTLANILVDEGVEVTEDDDMASLITKTDEEFADQKQQLVDKLISEGLEVSTNNTFEELISGIALGKKMASGTSTSKSSTHSFTTAENKGIHSLIYFDISNLSFIPSTIVYMSSNGSVFGVLSSVGKFYTNAPKYVLYTQSLRVDAGNIYTYPINADSTVFINSSTVRLPCNIASAKVDWIAFE